MSTKNTAMKQRLQERSHKIAYLDALFGFMKKSNQGEPSAVRAAVQDYYTMEITQHEAASRHNVSQAAVARMLRRLSEIDIRVQNACALRKKVEQYDDFAINRSD